jgi:hypothetical protein
MICSENSTHPNPLSSISWAKSLGYLFPLPLTSSDGIIGSPGLSVKPVLAHILSMEGRNKDARDKQAIYQKASVASPSLGIAKAKNLQGRQERCFYCFCIP